MLPEEIESFNERVRNAIGGNYRPERSIWVTSLSYCLRRTALDIYLHAYNPSKSWEARIGSAPPTTSASHSWRAEFEVPIEYHLKEGWKLTGRADAVKDTYVLEFKFKGFERRNDEARSSVSKRNRDLKHAEPSREWIEQINAYMGTLGKEMGYIYIFDRNGLDFRVFQVEFNEKLFKRFVKRAELVIRAVDHLEEGKFPRWISTVGKKVWVCNNCPYRPICAEIDREELLIR